MTWSGLTMVTLASAWMSAAVTAPSLVDLDLKGEGFAFLGNDENLFQVQDDVGDVFDDAVDRLELVLHAIDLDRRDGAALDGREKDATQGITDGVTVAGLERLGDELGVGGRGALLNLSEFVGQFELSETFGHGA